MADRQEGSPRIYRPVPAQAQRTQERRPPPYTARMQIYMVGGAVRDRLLGRPVNDRDWVVVGATPDDLAARGFLPVGRDFPSSSTPRRARNTRWRAPSARAGAATAASSWTRPRT